jgi:branched-chain amino acid transport system substrate-binding protein
VTQTKSLDHEMIAQYIRANKFSTVAGEVAFGPDGEWAESRTVFTQFQGVQPGNIEQFKDTERQVVVWPEKHATGKFIYPYADAKK